jgi:DNA mismatch repair ATPase MutS
VTLTISSKQTGRREASNNKQLSPFDVGDILPYSESGNLHEELARRSFFSQEIYVVRSVVYTSMLFYFIMLIFLQQAFSFRMICPSRCQSLYSSSSLSVLKYHYKRSFSKLNLINRQSIDNNEVSLDHLNVAKSEIPAYWVDQLSKIERSQAKSLISQLTPSNMLGFDPGSTSTELKGPFRKGGLLGFALQQKKDHSNKVILMRNGDFYETWGIDSIMLINYCGLNPMGGKCKAGCPKQNIQQTLDGLTSAGLSVAVYEEIAEIDSSVSFSASSGMEKKSSLPKMKTRALTQIVSPASSTYLYDLCLKSDDIEFKDNRPAVGILKTPASGYLLCQIYLDEQCMTISERLTEEAIHSILSNSGVIDPIYLQTDSSSSSSSSSSALSISSLSFLSHHLIEKLSGYKETSFPSAVLAKVASFYEIKNLDSFRIVSQNYDTSSSSLPVTHRRPRPVYTSTALQIGLLPNDNVPSLLPFLLPRSSSSSISYSTSTKFLRKWLLNPPPHYIADHMQNLCFGLLTLNSSLPSFSPVSIGKITSLLTKKQCNIALFREIRSNIQSLLLMLEDQEGLYSSILPSLLAITTYESGISAENMDLLKEGCYKVLKNINSIIAEDDHEDMYSKDDNERIPEDFFRKNEELFRNKININVVEIQRIYQEINNAVKKLQEIIDKEIPKGIEIIFDMNENSLNIKEKPLPVSSSSSISSSDTSTAEGDTPKRKGRAASIAKKGPAEGISGIEYIPYLDKRRKIVPKRYTTENLQIAVNDYLELVEDAPLKISRILQQLSSNLLKDLITIIQTSHFAVILQAILLHTISSKQKGWTLPTLINFPLSSNSSTSPDSTSTSFFPSTTTPAFVSGSPSSVSPLIDLSSSSMPSSSTTQTTREDISLNIHEFTPYWLSRDLAIKNNIELSGIILLTAPNMSGKSTLMRSVLVIALLANCGLFIPASMASIPRFDTFFLRTASYDIPSEAKSAFALEMDDIRVILRDCTSQSLVMIDELGKTVLFSALLCSNDHYVVFLSNLIGLTVISPFYLLFSFFFICFQVKEQVQEMVHH